MCFQNLRLQIERVSWRGTLAGCSVTVHQHLNGELSLSYGPHILGRYTAQGEAMVTARRDGLWKRRRRCRLGKRCAFPTFPQPLRLREIN